MSKVLKVFQLAVGALLIWNPAVLGLVFLRLGTGAAWALKAMNAAKAIGAVLALSGAAGLLKKKPRSSSSFGELAPRSGGVNPRRLLIGKFSTPGIKVFEKTFNNDEELYQIYVLGLGPIDGLTKITTSEGETIPAEILTDTGNGVTGKYAGLLKFYERRGFDSQTAMGAFTSRFAEWTDNHNLNGLVVVGVVQKMDQENLTGPLTFMFHGEGGVAYDPRQDISLGGTQEINKPWTYTATRNPVCWALTYLLGFEQNGVLVAGAGLDASRFTDSLPEIIASANICDEVTTRFGGGSQARYSIDGILDTTLEHGAVLQHIEQAMAGQILFNPTGIRILAGAWTPPTVTLGDDDLLELENLRTLVERSELTNTVQGTFANADNNGEIEEYPAIINATAKTSDGKANRQSLNLLLVGTASQGQRLAQIALKGARTGGKGGRIPRFISGTYKLTALALQVGDTMTLNLSHVMDGAATFRVVDRVFATANDNLAVQLDLVEETADVWADGTDLEHFGTPITPDFPGAIALAGLGAVATFRTGPQGNKTAGIKVTWTADTHPALTSAEIEFKPTAGAVWERRIAAPDAAVLDLYPLEPGETYDIRARLVHTTTGPGPWATANSVVASTEGTQGISVFNQDTAPATAGLVDGSVWIKSDVGIFYVLSGGVWVQTATDNETYYQTGEPAGGTIGDFWFDTDDGILYRHNGTTWQLIGNYVTDTNQLTDGAGLGTSAQWASVDGRSKIATAINETSSGATDNKRVRFFGFDADGNYPDRNVKATIIKPDGTEFTWGSTALSQTAYSGNGSNNVYYLVLDVSGGVRFDHVGTNDSKVGVCKNLGATSLEYFKASVGWASLTHDSNMIVFGFVERRAGKFVHIGLFEPTTIADAPSIFSLVGIDSPDHLPIESIAGVYTMDPSAPCTGFDNGASARVDIAATTIHFGDNTIGYSSGSITGLSFSTDYWVYAVDDNFVGGTVTYVAITDRTALPARAVYFGQCRTPANGAASTTAYQGGYAGLGGARDNTFSEPI